MPKIKVNDIGIYYELKGEGFPLVLIMGWGGGMDMWSPELLENLSKQFQLVLFDNRGVGRTDSPSATYSIGMFAKDTVDLMTQIGIQKAHILGVSMGGMIAQEIAISYPERVEKLILCSTSCGPGHSIPPSTEVLSVLMQSDPSPDDIVKIFFPEEYIVNNQDKINEFKEGYLSQQTTPEARMLQLGAIMGFDSYDRLNLIKAPTLVVTGSQDMLLPPGNSNILAGKISGAKLLMVEGCGHTLGRQIPGQLSMVISDYLE